MDSSGKLPPTLRQEMGLTTRLGVPLALGELGWMSTYIVDAIMVGRMPHSALSISASSLGNTIFSAIVFSAIGMLIGIETLTAQAYGRAKPEECLRTLAQSMWFVLLGTPAVMLLTIACLPLLRYFGISAELISETHSYLRVLIWSTAPLLLYMALRRYLQSLNRVILISISLITSSLVNLVGDWTFIYGHLGFRSMGLPGSALATCVVRIYMLLLLVVALVWSSRKEQLALKLDFFRPDPYLLRLLARIGWPAAIQNLTDLGFSTYMSIVCARLGTTLLAAHQVVLDLNAFVYMVPFGLAYATVVRVGQSAGRGSLPAVRRSAKASVLLGMGAITVAALLFAGLPRVWAGIYTNDPVVIDAAVPIFMICGVMLLGDAANVIFSGALIGLGDTRTPLFANTAIYWTIGMPLSYWLAFHTGLSLRGLWLGRAIAAVATGLALAWMWSARVRNAEGRRPVEALSVFAPVHAK